MQLFGFAMEACGLQLRFAIGFDEPGRKETTSQNGSGLCIQDLPRFEFSRD